MKISKPALKAALKFIDSWLDFQYQNSRWPGFTVAIQNEDQIVFNKAYGLANIKNKEKMTSEHVFRVASHSKTFTAVSIMQLVESGKLVLDDPLSKFLPWLKENDDTRVNKLTVRQVLEHASGLIRDGENANYWRLVRPFPDVNELKEIATSIPAVLDRNKKFKYSNIAYSLLGLVIESISGLKYDEYLKKNIFSKVDLKNTHAEYSKAIKTLATGYSRIINETPREPLPHASSRAMAPATGVCSTAEDLAKFYSQLFYGKEELLNDDSKRELLRLHWEVENEKERYGLGFDTRYIGKRNVYGHGGGYPGFVTNSIFDPEDNLTVVSLTNFLASPVQAMNDGVVTILDFFADNFNAKNGAKLNKFEGIFFSLWGGNRIVSMGDKLLSVWPESWKPFEHYEEYKPAGRNSFEIVKASGFSSPGEKVKYKFDANGKIKTVNMAGTDLYTWADYQKYLKKYIKQKES